MLMTILLTVSTATRAQVVPAATGPSGLPVSGTLHYDARYTQTAQFSNGTQGNAQRSNVLGELSYISAKVARPLTLTYSGGDMWTISGTSTGSGVFQHLLVSQGFLGRAWAFTLNDNVSYMPQSPTTGFSGISGVGTLPGEPGAPSQPIAQNARSINNVSGAIFKHNLSHSTTLNLSSSYQILRFPDGNGLETNTFQLSPQFVWRQNARNSITSQYSLSRFSYPDYAITMGTQSAQFGIQRTWSRRLKSSVSAGPEWIQGSVTAGIPSSTDLTVKADTIYNTKTLTATVSYTQAAAAGAGVATQIGVHNKDANATLMWQQGKNLSISFSGAYMRTTGLQQQQTGVTNSQVYGVVATRRWGRYITGTANYTATQQSTSSALPATAISGLTQVIGFGIGYSPLEVRLRK